MTKVQKFIKEVNKIADNVGAIKTERFWNIETRVGTYSFRAYHEPDEKRVKVFSIVGRFEEPERAYPVYPLSNQFSGKYNFHFFNMENCLDVFKKFLENAIKE